MTNFSNHPLVSLFHWENFTKNDDSETLTKVLQIAQDASENPIDGQFQNFQRNKIRGISIWKVLRRMVLRLKEGPTPYTHGHWSYTVWKVLHRLWENVRHVEISGIV